MNIAIGQINPIIGDLEGNMLKIMDAARKAREEAAQLVVFPELCLTGYPPDDLLQNAGFLREVEHAINHLVRATASGFPAMVIGAPTPNLSGSGKMLHNSALFLADGQIVAMRHKILLPDYDIFDEGRYFEPGMENTVFEWNGLRFGMLICEDAWNFKDPLGFDPDGLPAPARQPYAVNVFENWKNGPAPDLIINLSASPFSLDQIERRRRMVAHHVESGHFSAPFVYVNQIGANTSWIFDGGSMVIRPNGEFLLQCPWFEEGVFNINCFTAESVPAPVPETVSRIHQALILGISDFFRKNGFKKALLGLSGGIDSALVAALAAEALGPENVTGLLLPSPYSSDHSRDDALQLARNLGIECHEIPIAPMMECMEKTLMPFFKDRPSDVTEENMQSRIRGMLLMAFSNKFNYVLLNTTNKSEAAVGYGTLYGDMCGSLAVLGDVYKTRVWELAVYFNRKNGREMIPENSIRKAPSAELKPGQTDQDSLPAYALLDAILEKYIEGRYGSKDLLDAGFDPATVYKVLNLVNRHEFKRFQMAPVLRITQKAFGPGRRMPLTAKFTV